MHKRKIIIAVMLMLSVINYQRIPGHENVRAILVLSILTIGALLALLIVEFAGKIKGKKSIS